MIVSILQPPYPSPGQATAALVWQAEALRSIEKKSTDLILLPENCNCTGGRNFAETLHLLENEGRQFVAEMRAQAARIGAVIMAGVMTRDSAGTLRNQLMVIPPAEPTFFPYSKNHLVRPELERGILPGDRADAFVHNGILFGAAICFDFYFPELFCHYAKQRVDVLVIVSHQRQEPSENLALLSRARAFDCGCTLLRSAPAMDNPDVGGRSMVIAPDGRVLADAGGTPGVLTCEFDPKARFSRAASYSEPDRVGDYREVIQNACRPELYWRP